jgi:hypothetical protein
MITAHAADLDTAIIGSPYADTDENRRNGANRLTPTIPLKARAFHSALA